MSYFEKPPTMVLSTVAETLAWIRMHEGFRENPENAHSDLGLCRKSDGVKSIPVIQCIDAIVATGKYPYNYEVEWEATKALGLPADGWGTHKHRMEHGENSALGWLVYRAQGYRRSDRLIAEGFAPFTEAMVAAAFAAKAKIELQGENMIGGTVRNLLNVRKIQTHDGPKVFVMRPRSRNKHYPPNGSPARIVDSKGRTVPFTEPPRAPLPPVTEEDRKPMLDMLEQHATLKAQAAAREAG